MAIRYAIATGNWNATTTWDGGTLPTVGDDVYANGFTVTINQNINVKKISTEINPITSLTGGRFNLSTTGLILICDIVAGSTICLFSTNSHSVTIIGNIYGGSTAGAHGIGNNNTQFNTYNITGNVYGGAGASSMGIRTYVIPTINITGNVYGGIGSQSNGIQNDNGGVVNLIGSAYGSQGIAINTGFYINFGNTRTNITGYVESSSISHAVFCGSVTEMSGNLKNVAGRMAINTTYLYLKNPNPTTWEMQKPDNSPNSLYTIDVFSDLPVPADVRNGVSYASGALTGTLQVPSPSNVRKGVPTDNTVGTAELTAQDLFNEIASSSDIIAQRLRNVATVDTTAATIAAYNS